MKKSRKLRNEDLKQKYDFMHAQGASSWFSDGREERETILKMGEPWKGKGVFEIGCGEGDLVYEMSRIAAMVIGLDYSKEAIQKAKTKHPECNFYQTGYRSWLSDVYPDRLVMQGVLEHLDDPFGELQWMIDHFKPKTVITSSPCFLNPRGIVWMTLDMLGAVMSKTDLHFLHPWDFEIFCEEHGYKLKMKDCDWEWGNGDAMIQDMEKRIPLALKDGNLPAGNVAKLLQWLQLIPGECQAGATMVYRIDL
jgi:SAM-dependent methyltransferase